MTVPAKQSRTVFKLVTLVCFMLAMSFAAVPLYNLFCKVTGFGGTPQTASIAPTGDEILDRVVEIRFDGSLSEDMPWEFKPVAHTMDLRIGETGLAFFEAHNPTDRTIAGTATFNVFPYSVGAYFTKIDCFCFTMQVLEPGETVQMPVTFFVDPEIMDDPEANYVKTITLSYTFYETDLPEKHASLRPGDTNN